MKTYMQTLYYKFIIDLKHQGENIANSFGYSLCFAPVAWLVTYVSGVSERLFFRNVDFIMCIMAAVTLDAAIGIWKWIKLSKFNERLLVVGVLEKLGISLISLGLFNIIIFIIKDYESVVKGVNIVFMLALLLYPVLSAFKNMFFITNGKFPPKWIIIRFDNFNNTGSIEEIFKQEARKQEESAPPSE